MVCDDSQYNGGPWAATVISNGVIARLIRGRDTKWLEFRQYLVISLPPRVVVFLADLLFK